MNRFAEFTYKLYQHDLYEEKLVHLQFLQKTFLANQKKSIWLDKNILNWRVKTDLRNNFIVYYFPRGPWIVKIINCFCPLVLSTCHNGELLIACRHRALCYKKIRTTSTTALLISNVVVPNPYSHHAAFDPRSTASLFEIPDPFNRCLSLILNTLRPSNR